MPAVLASATSTTLPDTNRILLKGAESAVATIWPYLAAMAAFVVLVGVLRLAVDVRRRRRLGTSGIAEVDRMNGRAFEEFLDVLFSQLGYQVEATGRAGDFGADLVVTRAGVRCAVQAKQRSRGSVGIRAVQEVVGSTRHYRCARAMVVTNQRVTAAARQLAREHGVELWDRDVLIARMLQVRRQREAA